MRRKIAVGALVGFMAYTGAYIFVYLWRAFQVEAPPDVRPVLIWHGDNFMRAILVAILFLIGLVVLVTISLARQHAARDGSLRVRRDLWEWLVAQSGETNEPPARLAERALAAYRDRLEGTPGRRAG